MEVSKLLIVVLSLSIGTTAQGQWFGTADYLLMNRSDNSSTAFQRSLGLTQATQVLNETTTVTAPGGATTETVTPITSIRTDTISVLGDAINANSVDLDLTDAGRFALGYRFNDFLVGGSFLMSQTSQGTASADSALGELISPTVAIGTVTKQTVFTQDLRPDPLPLPVVTVPIDIVPGLLSTSANILYESEIATGDLFAAMPIFVGNNGAVDFLFGVRYLSIEEAFEFESENSLAARAAASSRTETRNRMFGPQVGVLVSSPFLEIAAFRIEFKSAIAANEIEKSVSLSDGSFDMGDEFNASWVNELNLKAELAITHRLSAHVGFQFLSVSNLALATDNFHESVDALVADAGRPTDGGSVYYYSPVFGMSLSF